MTKVVWKELEELTDIGSVPKVSSSEHFDFELAGALSHSVGGLLQGQVGPHQLMFQPISAIPTWNNNSRSKSEEIEKFIIKKSVTC